MKILLLGGNRFVGVEIIWHLLKGGHDITVLALDSPPAEVRPYIRWQWADRNDEQSLASFLANRTFDVVIDNIAYEPEQVGLLTRLLKDRVGRYVLTSTTDVYPGHFPRTYTEDQVEIREFDLTGLEGAPRYMYGKRSCEAVLMASGIPWTVFRPCIVTGPRDNRSCAPACRGIHWFEEGARSHFWPCRILDGGPQLMCREDEGVLQLVWVADLAKAVTMLLDDPRAVNQVYNTTGSEIWTNERLVRALCAAGGRTPEIVYASRNTLETAGLDYAPAYGSGPYWSLADNIKLRATGWNPTPAEQWLPRLLETIPEPILRPWYHTRIQEIALARHLQRRLRDVNRLPPAEASPCSFGRLSVHSVHPLSGRTAGKADAAATEAWRKRAQDTGCHHRPGDNYFRVFKGMTVSSIGIGTWMGDFGESTDRMYIETLMHGAIRGVNLFDTAINYRAMKAERCVGQSVRRLLAAGIPRESLLIATKGGYISNDAVDPRSWEEYARQEYLVPGLISEEELNRHHALNPRYIRRSLEQSIANLGLATVDLYYIHNPEDTAAAMSADAFYDLLCEVFTMLEGAASEGLICWYGLATWDGLRVAPDDPRHISLELALKAARKAAGNERHHLAAVQLPYNVKQPEARHEPTQVVNGVLLPVFEAAEQLGLYTCVSASAMQGASCDAEQAQKLRMAVPGASLAMASLQMVRTTPGVGSALVGMRRIAHLEDALTLTWMGENQAASVGKS